MPLTIQVVSRSVSFLLDDKNIRKRSPIGAGISEELTLQTSMRSSRNVFLREAAIAKTYQKLQRL